MRALLAVAVVSAFILAGCSGKTDDTTTTSTSGSHSTSTTSHGPGGGASSSTGPGGGSGGGGGGSGGGSGNKAPTGTISASIPAGGVPLNVTFTLTGTDPDKDPISWTLDADGDGKADTKTDAPASFPATYAFVYQTAGSYTANFTLSDGKLSTSRTFLVNATGSGAGQAASLTWTSGAYGCGEDYDTAVHAAPVAGTLYGELDVDAATYGLTFKADFGTFTGLFEGIIFYDSAGAKVAGGAAVFADPAVVTGTVPDGAVFAQFYNCGTTGSQADYTAA